MKIAFLHFYTFRLPRGIETLAISLANALVEKGEDVSMITASPTITPLISPDRRVKIYSYPVSHYYAHLSIVPFYVSHFLSHQYDIVTTFFADFGEGDAWRIVSAFKKTPLALYLCYPYSSVPHRYHSFLRYGWQSKAKYILADAVWVADEAQKLFQRPVPVVPVGADSNRFSPNPEMRVRMRAQFGYSTDDVILLNVSSLEHRKGVWRVVEAMGRLKERFPFLKYFILGQGEDEPKLRKMVDDLDLKDRVILGGTTSQLELFYNMADVFVMLPDAEANSVACIEAMSCGLPVVVSKNGGFAESVCVNAGFFVDPNSPPEIDAKLIEIITNQQLRLKMGKASREHVISHFSWDQIASQFLRVITS